MYSYRYNPPERFADGYPGSHYPTTKFFSSGIFRS
jgi:hypothetical protein